MLETSPLTKIFGIIAVVGFGVLAIFLFFQLVFGNPDNAGAQDEQPVDPVAELVQAESTDTSNSELDRLVYRWEGPTVAHEEKRSLEIIITDARRVVRIYTGYDNTVLAQQVLGNTESAFEEFRAGAIKLGLTTEREEPSTQDPATACPTGGTYLFSTHTGTDTVSELWTSRCNNAGTLGASRSTIQDFFEDQIPNYNSFERTHF